MLTIFLPSPSPPSYPITAPRTGFPHVIPSPLATLFQPGNNLLRPRVQVRHVPSGNGSPLLERVEGQIADIKSFLATVQIILLYDLTQEAVAELIMARAKSTYTHFDRIT